MDLSYKSDYTLLNLTKFRNDMLEKSEKKSIANTVFTMKVRGFITATKGYITFNFLPTIVFEGFKDSTKTIFVGWLIFGIQISWNTH